MQESRDFDVFFVIFGCLGERKNVGSSWEEGKFQKKSVRGCWGLFIGPSSKIEATAIVGPPASKLL